MTEHPRMALQKGVAARLKGDGNYPYGQYVRLDFVKSSTPYPYAIYFYSGGGVLNAVRGKDAELRYGVKTVSRDLSVALNSAQIFSDLLDDKGEQDSPNDFVWGGDDWKILTITEEEAINFTEGVTDSDMIYHIGAFFRFRMSAR